VGQLALSRKKQEFGEICLMAACSHTGNCALFPMISVNSALKVWRTFYCEGKWHECARYRLSLEGKPVPSNLLPNGKLLDMTTTESESSSTTKAPATEALSEDFDTEVAEVEKDIASISRPRAPVTEPVTEPVPAPVAPKPVAAASEPTRSYYVRMQIQPAPGVMSEIIRTLGEARVRIDAVTEKKGSSSDMASYLIVLTDQTARSTIDGAIPQLQGLASVVGEIKLIELEEMKDGQLI
jgi:hypothetical protein